MERENVERERERSRWRENVERDGDIKITRECRERT